MIALNVYIVSILCNKYADNILTLQFNLPSINSKFCSSYKTNNEMHSRTSLIAFGIIPFQVDDDTVRNLLPIQ